MKKWAAILAGLAMMSVSAHAQPNRIYKVHFRKLVIPPGLRIEGLGLKVACAHILNIDNVPDDWSIRTIRAISAVEEFGAEAGHGASWLNDLKPLDGVLTVSVSTDGASCFSIYGSFFASDSDGKERKVRIRFSDVRLEPRR